MQTSTLLTFYAYLFHLPSDVKPKELGLPTDAYIAVEEIHDVRAAMHIAFFRACVPRTSSCSLTKEGFVSAHLLWIDSGN